MFDVTLSPTCTVWPSIKIYFATRKAPSVGVPVGVPTTIFLLSPATLPKPPVRKRQAVDSRALLFSPLPSNKNGES